MSAPEPQNPCRRKRGQRQRRHGGPIQLWGDRTRASSLGFTTSVCAAPSLLDTNNRSNKSTEHVAFKGARHPALGYFRTLTLGRRLRRPSQPPVPHLRGCRASLAFKANPTGQPWSCPTFPRCLQSFFTPGALLAAPKSPQTLQTKTPLWPPEPPPSAFCKEPWTLALVFAHGQFFLRSRSSSWPHHSPWERSPVGA